MTISMLIFYMLRWYEYESHIPHLPQYKGVLAEDFMNKKVAIIDDDTDILDVLKLTLEDVGYITKTSLRGENVESIAKDFHPDIILLDVLLSGTDGRAVCKLLKSNDETKKIPVVMMSAHPNARESVMEVGAEEFIEKPFDINELLIIVEKYAN